MSKLAVVTVNYNSYSDVEEWARSFKGQENYELYIVDVSPDPEPIDKREHIHVIRADNNGYAYGINVGVRAAMDAGYTQFVAMNNDVVVAKDFVMSVRKSIDKHPMSLIGGKIYYYKGNEYHQDRYNKSQLGKVLWYAGGEVDWDHAMTNHRGVDMVDDGQYDEFEETDFVTGCLMCFDKALHDKVGYMDESYFLYYEDADWCERVKEADLKLYYDPSIVIWHKNSQSTDGPGSELHQRYQSKNRLKFGMRYAPLKTKLHLMKNRFIGNL